MDKVVLNESEQREVDLITEEFKAREGLQQLINECIDKCLRKYLLNKVSLNEAKQPKEKKKQAIKCKKN